MSRNRLPTLPQKRAHAGSQQQLQLPEPEQRLYDLIRSKEDMGMWTADMKSMLVMNTTILNKALKSLQAKNLIKEVVNVQNKARKYYMGVEFEPSKQLTGGSWYSEGNLDTEFIEILRRLCLRHMKDDQVVELEDLRKFIMASPVLKEECSLQQVEEIVRSLILDKEVEEMRSTGTGIFSKVKQGKTCYRRLKGREGPKVGYFSSVPCGVCPRIRECTPDGVISPRTCVYYNKWLKLEF